MDTEMNFLKYGQSPVMKLDCSNDFKCDVEIESDNWDNDKNDDKDIVFGILGTDYDNWHIMYVCGEFWGAGVMQTFSIFGKSEKIDQKYIDDAIATLEAKVPEISASTLLMKDGGQGSDIMLGLGQCEYEWNLDQKEKFK